MDDVTVEIIEWAGVALWIAVGVYGGLEDLQPKTRAGVLGAMFLGAIGGPVVLGAKTLVWFFY